MSKRFVDLTGQTFGRLKVLRHAGSSPNKCILFECECSCGNKRIFRASHIVRGEIKSCGCYRRETSAQKIAKIATTHGHCTHGISKTYRSWSAMLCRCTHVTHPHYNRYGGRGITICDRWLTFENFLEDMGERPVGKTLDRIDGNGNYSKENCKWSTWKEQANHTCKTRYLSLNGETLSISEWANKLGVMRNTLRMRLERGWSTEETLTHPVLCNTNG